VPKKIVGNISVFKRYAMSNVLVIPKLLNKIRTATTMSLRIPNTKMIVKEAMADITQKIIMHYLRENHRVITIHANDAKSSAVPENIAKR